MAPHLPCRLLVCSGIAVLPSLCSLFPGYFLSFLPVFGSLSAPFLPRSCSVCACCLAVLAIYMGGERKCLVSFCLWGHWLVSWESGGRWTGGEEGSPTASLMVERLEQQAQHS